MTSLSVTLREISNAFNEQFSTIYRAQTNPGKAFKFGRGVYLFDKQYFWKITTNSVFVQLLQCCLYPSSQIDWEATGLDNNESMIRLAESADLISGPLCNLFNKSWCLAYFLTTGNMQECDYARIIWFQQLPTNLTESFPQSPHQSPFRSLHLTVTALPGVTDSLAFDIDCGCINATVFLASKTTNQNKSVWQFKRKLFIGLNRIMILASRPHRCYVESYASDFIALKFNVVCHREQSLAFFYILFLLTIWLTPCLSPSVPRMHAVDTHTILSHVGSDLHRTQSCLSHDLEKPRKWLACNRLTLNATKTEFMLIGSRKGLTILSDTHELSTDNVPTEQVSSVK